MRDDEAKLRVYLDGELTPEEREALEMRLADSPELQTKLAQVRQRIVQVNRLLNSLAPAAENRSAAVLALKQVKAQTALPNQVTVPSGSKSSQVVWESPSLLAEIKAAFKNLLAKRRLSMGTNILQWKLVWLTSLSLAIILSASLLVFGSNWGPPLAQQITNIAVPEQLIAPQPAASVELSQANRHLLADVVPVEAVFNNEIELVGYKLDQSGEALKLILYWHSDGAAKAEYMVFVHLADANGMIVSQIDKPPTEGTNPIQNWQSNEIIIDHYELTLPKDLTGLHNLLVGMYKNETGERLTVQSARQTTPDNSVLLTQVQLGQITPTPIPASAPVQTGQIGPTPIPASAPLEVPFGYGIQADPLGNTEADIVHLKALGLEWVKFQMPWKAVEPTQGSYDWETWDKVIDAYAASEIKIMLSIPKAPDWARPADDDKMVEGPPADPAKYAEFVAKVTERYKSKVQAIEIWNEQNLWYEAGGQGRINATNYVKLLQLAYSAIKSVNQDMMVISGALTPAGNQEDLAVDDVEYLKQMYENGVKGYFDALGAHPAGYNCPALADWRTVTAEEATADTFPGPFQNRHHSWCFLGTMEAYREVMIANGDEGKAITITEFGWAVSDTADPKQGYGFARDNTLEEQAKWIVEVYQWGKQQGWVGPMFLWNLDFSANYADTELTYFGIVNTPAYESVSKMTK